MKITNLGSDSSVQFKDLRIGAAFSVNDGGLYIKTSGGQAFVLLNRQSGNGPARFSTWSEEGIVFPVVELTFKT